MRACAIAELTKPLPANDAVSRAVTSAALERHRDGKADAESSDSVARASCDPTA